MKRLIVWIVEDNKEFRESLVDCLKEDIPTASVDAFEFAFDACESTGSPDYVLCDVASFCTAGGWDPHHYAGPILSLMNRHPGAIYIIYSGIDHWATEVIAEIQKAALDAVVVQSRAGDLIDTLLTFEGEDTNVS